MTKKQKILGELRAKLKLAKKMGSTSPTLDRWKSSDLTAGALKWWTA